MHLFTKLVQKLKTLHPLSYVSFKLGITLMISLYIIAIAAYLLAPIATDYFYAMSVYRGCLQAAPASLAVGVCAGLLGDLMLRRNDGDHDLNDHR